MRSRRISAGLIWLSQASLYILLALMPLISRWEMAPRRAFNLSPEYISTIFYLVDIPLLVTVGAWLLANLLDSSRTISLAPRPLSALLLALAFVSIISIFRAQDSILAAESAMRLLVLLAFYLFLANEVHDYRRPALALGLGAVLQSLLALGQFLAGSSLGLAFLGEMQLDAFSPSATVIEIGDQRWLRGFGLAASPNVLGGILVLAIFALLSLGMQRSRRSMGWLAALGLILSGLLATFSRSAWLGLAGGLVVVTGLLWGVSRDRTPTDAPSGTPPPRRHQPRSVRDILTGIPLCSHPAAPALWRLVALGLGVGAAFLLVYPQLFAARLLPGQTGPVTSLESLNLSMRARYQQTAWVLIERHPLSGVGGNNFALAASLEVGPAEESLFGQQPVHNALFLLTAELGLAGGALWLAIWAVLALALWQNRAHLGRQHWLLAWTGALIAVAILSNFDHYLLTYQQGRLLLWTVLGLWAGAARERLSWRWPSWGPARPCPRLVLPTARVWLGFALVVLAAVGVGVLLYTRLILPRGPLLWDPAGFAWRGWYAWRNLGTDRWQDLSSLLLRQPTYPPGHALLLAGLFALWGDAETVARLSSVVSFLLATALMYWLGWATADSANRRPLAGWLAAGLTLTSPTLLYLSSDVQLEPLGLLFTLAAILCAGQAVGQESWPRRRPWLIAAGLLTTTTWMIKYNYGLLLLVGIGLSILLLEEPWPQRRRTFTVLALTTLLPLGLWFVTEEQRLGALIAFAVNRSSGLPWWKNFLFYPLALLRDYAAHWLLGCAILLAFVLAVLRWRQQSAAMRLQITTVLAGLVLALLHPYKEARFIYTIAPLVFLPAAIGAGALVHRWLRGGQRLLWRRIGLALPVLGLLLLSGWGGLATLDRYQEGENERLNYDPAAQQTIAEILSVVGEQAQRGQGVLVNGCFNELGEGLLRWTWRGRPEAEVLLPCALTFEGVALREKRVAEAEHWIYLVRLEQALAALPVQRIVSISIRPGSRFYTSDYARWNAWQQSYHVAMDQHPALRLVQKISLEGGQIRIHIYQLSR